MSHVEPEEILPKLSVSPRVHDHYVSFQLAKALKDLPTRVQTASKKERREILQNVVNVLSNPGKRPKRNAPFSDKR